MNTQVVIGVALMAIGGVGLFFYIVDAIAMSAAKWVVRELRDRND